MKYLLLKFKAHGGTSSSSHRDSVASIKSINSDTTEDYNKAKIVLDETVNPKRPLRPNRLTTQNSISSPSNSNQSSRPGSHISGEELNSLSQQFNTSSNNTTADGLQMQEEMEIEIENVKSSMKPPPKPPKPNNMKKIISNTSLILQEANSNLDNQNSNNSSFNSSQNLISTPTTKNTSQTKSNTSLNNIQFKNLGSKTTSDSILNRVIFFFNLNY